MPAVRFPVQEFRPDRSHRRTLKRNADLIVRVGHPICEPQRMDLFQRYHFAQHETKQWPYHADSADEYEFSFVRNQIPTTEISVWDGRKLLGVLITENTPNVISAVYHYYDPAMMDRGLGTFLVLQCAEYARARDKRWMYMGYYVEGCAGMAYKKRFKPCEVMGHDGIWRTIAQ